MRVNMRVKFKPVIMCKYDFISRFHTGLNLEQNLDMKSLIPNIKPN